MSLSVGIVGLPNAGKSTLFNALLGRQQALVAERPFTTIEPNIGVVAVPDKVLAKLAAIVKPQKTTPAIVKFVDIAGLVKGAHQGEGLGNQFLAHIRDCDAILHLIRTFRNPQVARVKGSDSPKGDREIIELELVMADLEQIGQALSRVKKKARIDLEINKVLSVLEKIKLVLEAGKLAARANLNAEELEIIKGYNLLTTKPVIFVLNTDETAPSVDLGMVPSKRVLEVCARLEAELVNLDPDEKKELLFSAGIKQSALDKLIISSYRLLNLITFYTIKGDKEVKAWSIRQGATMQEAAKLVHTDMAKGFIKAETVLVDNLLKTGGWQEAKSKGIVRFESRRSRVKDGDVIEFIFS